MPFGGLLTAGLIGAGGSIISGLFGASAATKASQAQTRQEQAALQFQEQEYSDQKANQAPFVSAGQSSIASLMAGIANGTFGSVPTFTPPTLEEARATPGYEFTRQQGEQGIERGAAAAGGAVTGGTLKALAGFDTGLADSTYNQIFQNTLSAYGANLSGKAQAFNQLLAPAQLGESAAANAGNTGAQASATIGSTLGSIGQSQASGIISSADAIRGAIGGVTSAATTAAATPFYLQQLRLAQGYKDYTPPYGGGQNLPPEFGNGTVATPLAYVPTGGG